MILGDSPIVALSDVGYSGNLAVVAVIARDILANTAQEQAHVFRATMMLPTGGLTGVPRCAAPYTRLRAEHRIQAALPALRASIPNAECGRQDVRRTRRPPKQSKTVYLPHPLHRLYQSGQLSQKCQQRKCCLSLRFGCRSRCFRKHLEI